MNKKTISLILLTVFVIGLGLTVADTLLDDSTTAENQTGTLEINDAIVHYEKSGKCLEVIDGNTIQVYGVGRVQLDQIKTPDTEPGFSQAKKFVEDKCLGKTVYLDIDDEQPEDKYGRALAIVYTENSDVNKDLLDKGLGKISYFEPSEFEKGEI